MVFISDHSCCVDEDISILQQTLNDHIGRKCITCHYYKEQSHQNPAATRAWVLKFLPSQLLRCFHYFVKCVGYLYYTVQWAHLHEMLLNIAI